MPQNSENLFEEFSVSRETLEMLRQYEAEIKRWNPKINLVAKSQIDQLWQRHIIDSAQLFPLMPNSTELAADFGSGGGFPAIVLAIIAKEKQPSLSYVLVESDLRKATFLMTMIHKFGLKAEVKRERIENLAPLGSNLITARALAPLTDLLKYTEPHLQHNGTALFLKGETAHDEIVAAEKDWFFQSEITPSMTNPEARILKITSLSKRSKPD